MASVSTSAAPSSTSVCATVLLPLPMPPVRPMCKQRIPVLSVAGCAYQPIQASTRSVPASITTRPPPARKGPKGT